MTAEGRSLLPFLPAPVAVGDPDGRAVYVNPAFARRFGVAEREVRGRPLAELFAGGGREAVLRATAAVCGQGREARFRLREDERDYAVVAAPIVAEGSTVGLVLLFCEEPLGQKRLLAFHREIQEPLADLAQCLDLLLEQTGGRRAERFRSQVETGIRAAERIRKWADELAAEIVPGQVAGARHFEPFDLAQDAGEALARAARRAGRAFDLLLPAGLPPVRGDGERLAVALTRFALDRVEASPEGTSFTLTARLLDGSVLLSFTEVPPPGAASFSLDDDSPPLALAAAVEPLGGSVTRVADPLAGITTSLRLPVA